MGDQFVSDDSRLLASETMTSETKLNNLNIQGRYNRNAPNGFVANVLKVDTHWNSDRVDGLLASERTGANPANYGNNRVRQHFDRPQLSVSNTFNTIRNIGKNTFDLHFSAGYAHRPNTLTVGVDSLLQGTSTAYTQDVNSHHIAASFNTSYAIRVGQRFRFSYGVSATANLHGIVTDLDGFTPPAEHAQLDNDLWYNTYCVALAQTYKYETPNFYIGLGLPLELYTQTLDDKIRNDQHGYTHLLFFPSLSANWSISRDLWLNAGTSYSKTVGDPGGIYSGYIMSNYRAFQRSYVEQLSATSHYGANASLRYRSALRALFANVGIGYRRTHDNQIYGYSYEGATSVVQAVDQQLQPQRRGQQGVRLHALHPPRLRRLRPLRERAPHQPEALCVPCPKPQLWRRPLLQSVPVARRGLYQWLQPEPQLHRGPPQQSREREEQHPAPQHERLSHQDPHADLRRRGQLHKPIGQEPPCLVWRRHCQAQAEARRPGAATQQPLRPAPVHPRRL